LDVLSFSPGLEQSHLDNRRSPKTHGDRNRPVPDYPVVQTVEKEKINEIYTGTRWDAVDILSVLHPLGLTGANLLMCLKNWNGHDPTGEGRFELSACNP
jgi:hypothetical protein